MDVLKEVSLLLHKSVTQVRQGKNHGCTEPRQDNESVNTTVPLPPTIRGMELEKLTEVS
jgi:hypothetical protein